MPQFAAARFRVYGDEQGGMTALLAAALDTRFEEATVNDYYGASLTASEQPFDRMLYGQLIRFGDAEFAALIAPRKLTLGLIETRAVESELARAKHTTMRPAALKSSPLSKLLLRRRSRVRLRKMPGQP